MDTVFATLAVIAVVALLVALLLTLRRTGNASLLGHAPLAGDQAGLFSRPGPLPDPDRH